MTSQPRDLRPTCSRCGGRNVEEIGWTAYRPDGTTFTVSTECPYSDYWCADCESDAELTYPEATPEEYRQAEANDAAREAGPELLAACRRALSVYCTPKTCGNEVVAMLRRAIATAEGRAHE